MPPAAAAAGLELADAADAFLGDCLAGDGVLCREDCNDCRIQVFIAICRGGAVG